MSTFTKSARAKTNAGSI